MARKHRASERGSAADTPARRAFIRFYRRANRVGDLIFAYGVRGSVVTVLLGLLLFPWLGERPLLIAAGVALLCAWGPFAADLLLHGVWVFLARIRRSRVHAWTGLVLFTLGGAGMAAITFIGLLVLLTGLTGWDFLSPLKR